jgi:uncharacterized protein (TIGR02611 family)
MSGRRDDDAAGPDKTAAASNAATPGIRSETAGAASPLVDGEAAARHHQDRWLWRRKIRANPHQLRVYRVVVAIAGLLLVVLGFVTGPIPGPGGIPLVLLGLACWASEFAWAHRLMHWFKAQLHRFRSWTRLQQVGFWVVFFAVCGLCGYAFMLVMGIPTWLPKSADALLEQLPGL